MFAEDCPFKVVRTNGSDEVLARAANLPIGRGRIRDREADVSEGLDRISAGGSGVGSERAEGGVYGRLRGRFKSIP
jgi:hypothetical protein